MSTDITLISERLKAIYPASGLGARSISFDRLSDKNVATGFRYFKISLVGQVSSASYFK